MEHEELNDEQLLAIFAGEEEGGAPEGMEGVMIEAVEGNAHAEFTGILVMPGFELLDDLEVLDAYWVCSINVYMK